MRERGDERVAELLQRAVLPRIEPKRAALLAVLEMTHLNQRKCEGFGICQKHCLVIEVRLLATQPCPCKGGSVIKPSVTKICELSIVPTPSVETGRFVREESCTF